MSSKAIICEYCGAPILAHQRTARYLKCEYCGMEYAFESTENTAEIRYVDEARLKEAQLKEKAFEAIQSEKLKREAEGVARKKKMDITLAAAIGLFALGFFSGFSLFTVCGIIAAIFYLKMRSELKTMDADGLRTYYEKQGIPGTNSDKNRWIALALCFFLGTMGVHYFYVGRIGKGILYLCTLGLFGIGWLVDLIMIATGNFRDSNRCKLV